MLVFVSYSHEDHRWFSDPDLIGFLSRSVKRDGVTIWHDERMPGGTPVWPELREKIKAADIAILLVSQEFLNSDYIQDKELPEIEREVEAGRMIVIPILVGPCNWEDVDLIEKVNVLPMLPSSGPQPLVYFVDNEPQLQRHRQQILESLREQIARVREKHSGDEPPEDPTSPGPTPRPRPTPRTRRHSPATVRRLAFAALATLVAVAAVVLGWSLLQEKRIDTAVSENMAPLMGAMPWLDWLVYEPVGWDPIAGSEPSKASIRRDIQVLRQHGFDGLVTCSAQGVCAEVPRIAHEEGFNMVIMGLWNPKDRQEVVAAIDAARWADAYCVGHRGLNTTYQLGKLRAVAQHIRRETKKPITTSELVRNYADTPELLDVGDFYCPDAHAKWHSGMRPEAAWEDTLDHVHTFTRLIRDREPQPVLYKMVSFPSDGARYLTPENQLRFYRLAVEGKVDNPDVPGNASFAFLAAFDPVWKTEENGFVLPEMHTGLFTAHREPKPVVTEIKWERHRR